MPCRAIPIATPTMPDSASGVSITRSSPKSSRKPCETLKTPPRVPTSSPSRTIRSSAAISACSVSRIAVTRLTGLTVASSANTWRSTVAGSGSGASQAAVIAASTSVLTSSCRVCMRSSIPQALRDQVGGESVDRVPVLVLGDLLARPIRLVVVIGRVGVISVRLAFDQGRAVAGDRARTRLLHHAEAREHVAAVDDDAGHPVALGPGRDVAHGHLLVLAHADRVLVVLAHEQHGQVMDRGEVEPLVPVALARRPLAEPATRPRRPRCR